jgi:hypothetical protein
VCGLHGFCLAASLATVLYRCVSHVGLCLATTLAIVLYRCVSHVGLCLAATLAIVLYRCVSHVGLCLAANFKGVWVTSSRLQISWSFNFFRPPNVQCSGAGWKGMPVKKVQLDTDE